MTIQDGCERIFRTALKEIDLKKKINKLIKVKDDVLEVNDLRISLYTYSAVRVIGFGKASVKMGLAMEELLGDRIGEGILVTDFEHPVPTQLEVVVAGHPLPNQSSFAAGRKVIELVRNCPADNLLVFLISGGGSSLCELPVSAAVSLDDLRALNQVLVTSSATIREINVIRKHLSMIKGGRLGYLARDKHWIAFYVSDVNPGDWQTIASNPLLEDTTAPGEFFEVVERYGLMDKVPSSIRRLIELGEISALPRGWGKPDPGVQIMLFDNQQAVAVLARVAEESGYRTEICTEWSEGPYREAADQLLERLLMLHRAHPDQPVCLVNGGELACEAPGGGTGGRNQEFVLYCGTKIANLSRDIDVAVLSCGTDGVDGNSGAAGAVTSGEAMREILSSGDTVWSYIHESDSHSFFKNNGGAVFTGPTGNNVRDLRIFLATPHRPCR